MPEMPLIFEEGLRKDWSASYRPFAARPQTGPAQLADCLQFAPDSPYCQWFQPITAESAGIFRTLAGRLIFRSATCRTGRRPHQSIGGATNAPCPGPADRLTACAQVGLEAAIHLTFDQPTADTEHFGHLLRAGVRRRVAAVGAGPATNYSS